MRTLGSNGKQNIHIMQCRDTKGKVKRANMQRIVILYLRIMYCPPFPYFLRKKKSRDCFFSGMGITRFIIITIITTTTDTAAPCRGNKIEDTAVIRIDTRRRQMLVDKIINQDVKEKGRRWYSKYTCRMMDPLSRKPMKTY